MFLGGLPAPETGDFAGFGGSFVKEATTGNARGIKKAKPMSRKDKPPTVE